MPTLEEMAGPSGTVTVGDRAFTLTRLSLSDEFRLADRLEELTAEYVGEHYRKAKKRLLAEADPQDRETIVRELVRLEVSDQSRIGRVRYTPKGAAFELWLRAKAAAPDTPLEAVEAVVTAANCHDVAEQIRAVLTKGN